MEYAVSVVMPIYNTEKYLKKAIDSVIAQTLGFQNIQMILVDDGSTDTSAAICQTYVQKYPDNMVYLRQEHRGAAAARNAGIPYIKGKYVNFLDSDDYWKENALEMLYRFLEENQTDAAAARKVLFDGARGYHELDYRFAKTRVVDLTENFDMIQTDVTSALLRTDAIGELRFCEELTYGEDTRFINTFLLKKNIYGLVREAELFCRMRTDGTAVQQGQEQSDSYYFTTPTHLHQFLIEQSQQPYGEVPKFIQYVLAYDIAKRVKKPLKQELCEKYKPLICEILQSVDDEIIYRQRCIYMNMKMYCLSLKYGHDVRKDLTFDSGRIQYKDFTVIDFATAKTLLIWDYVELRGNILRLEGKDNCWMRGRDYNYYAQIDGETYYPSYRDCPKFDLITMEGRVNKGRAVIYEFHLNPNKETHITFYYRKGNDTCQIDTSLGRFSHLPKTEGGYYARGKYIVQAAEKGLKVSPYTEKRKEQLESHYQELLLQQGKKEAVAWRNKYFEAVKHQKKELWLISDRTYVANDNGEHFFRYMNRPWHKKVETYFNINADSPDYERMKKIGKVIPYGTDAYKLKFLLADKLISSVVSDYLFNPFGEDMPYLVDLIHYDFIFLQHGITKDDLSGWLNRYNKNISMLVTAAVPEYDSFVKGDYCMTKHIPVITGFPRFDALYKRSKKSRIKKKILIMPTWRQYIKGSYDPKENKSIYIDTFKDTKFFAFYNALINDERLLKVMKEHGYKGLFCMHPMQSEQWRDFDGNDVFAVQEGAVDYQKEFVQGAVLVTDYSSVAFDFAYLQKPVIYARFDKEEFYGNHTYKEGYFDYEKDGFGTVCHDLDGTVNALMTLIQNGCQNEETYLQRVKNFYPYHDAHNCRRVYEKIKALNDDDI